MNWSAIYDFGLISVFLIIATLLRSKVQLFQKYLIPNNIIAGFIGLIVGSQVLGWTVIPVDRLGDYVYHLLAIAFIALGLRQTRAKAGKSALRMSFNLSLGYTSQALIGFALTMLFIYTIWPTLFPTFGLHLVLGFGQGPGQAYSIGQAWENFGFTAGSSVGLTFAAIGFLWACFAGIPLVNWGIRRGYAKYISSSEDISEEIRTGLVSETGQKKVGGYLSTSSEAIDTMALQVALIVGTYLLTFLILSGLTSFMASAGDALDGFVEIVWGLHFIFATIVSIGVRRLLDTFGIGFIIDEGMMTRAGGVAIDYMVAAAIVAIPVLVVAQYFWPIMIISTLGGLWTLVMVVWIGSRGHTDFEFERTVAIFGALTGSIATGLALLRIVDPEFRSPVAKDLAYGSAVALVLMLPLLLAINIPVVAYTQGQPVYYLYFAVGVLIYFALLVGAWRILNRINFTRPLTKMWPNKRATYNRHG